MKTIPLVTFNELEPAVVLQKRLQQAGVPATIHDESKLERFWFMSAPFAAIHLEVPQSHYLGARRLLLKWDKADHALHSAVRCPECQSSRVEFPAMTRKFVTPVLMRLFTTLRIFPEEFYCLDCQYTWPTVMPIQPKLDNLNWPVNSHMGDPRTVRVR